MKKTFSAVVALAFAIPALAVTSVPAYAVSAQGLTRSKAPSVTDKKRRLKPAMPRVEAGSTIAEAILNRR